MDIDRELEQMGNVPFNADVLISMMKGTKAPDKKLSYLEKQGKIIRLKRGMYIVSPDTSRRAICTPLIANHLYGPSYVSFQTALRYWGLIPERVYAIQSMTLKRAKSFGNTVGRFEYIHVKEDYYPIGIRMVTEDGVSYLMASPEKALCDLIVSTPYLNLRYMQELRTYLEDDIRLDMDEFAKMDVSVFESCAKVSMKHVMINNLAHLLR
jgi:predicted transcriptional regulator of viral defense system